MHNRNRDSSKFKNHEHKVWFLNVVLIFFSSTVMYSNNPFPELVSSDIKQIPVNTCRMVEYNAN